MCDYFYRLTALIYIYIYIFYVRILMTLYVDLTEQNTIIQKAVHDPFKGIIRCHMHFYKLFELKCV